MSAGSPSPGPWIQSLGVVPDPDAVIGAAVRAALGARLPWIAVQTTFSPLHGTVSPARWGAALAPPWRAARWPAPPIGAAPTIPPSARRSRLPPARALRRSPADPRVAAPPRCVDPRPLRVGPPWAALADVADIAGLAGLPRRLGSPPRGGGGAAADRRAHPGRARARARARSGRVRAAVPTAGPGTGTRTPSAGRRGSAG